MFRLTLLYLFASSAPLWAGNVLKAGFAESDVTPKLSKAKPVYIAGFGYNRRATEIHDPIMARAVVLEDDTTKIAMVCVDVVGLFHPFVESIRKQLPGFRYVLVSSTHNHEGPDTLGLWGQTPFHRGVDPDYLQQVEAGVVQAVKDADALLRPVDAKIGTVSAPELLNDSREPYIKHDDLVAIHFTDSRTKKPVGVVVQWNCHPESLGSKNTKLSADFVAGTVTQLRKSQGCPVAYFTGTVGGLMGPPRGPIKGADPKRLNEDTFERTDAYGRAIGRLAEKALKDAKPIALTPFEVRTQALLLPVDNRLYQLGWTVQVLKREIYVWEGTPFPKKMTLAKDLQKRGALRTEIGYLKLGELEVAVIPGEIYPELVLGKVQDPADPGADFRNAPIEPWIYAQFKGKHRMLIGLGNDEIGYIIPKRQWDEKAPFCYGRKEAQYGEINSTGPETAPILCKAFEELVDRKK